MTKNIPGSRRKRRSKSLRQLTSLGEITLKLGSFGMHGFSAFDELHGKLSYEAINGDRGYYFEKDQHDEIRIYIRGVNSVNRKEGIINYLV